ncbi:UNKNOWN [Stylonychia lemnae]|uniref:Uncharacterized protein n=1 Tax=Stylonychia lemnae TaxID=5949 RepID=A0A077ZRP9_STYLE|nr:UNKNOWN [Stylonychia lemnae]|eukprot:CDW72598.1 UNKNOWN [Stylonychia lemnae]
MQFQTQNSFKLLKITNQKYQQLPSYIDLQINIEMIQKIMNQVGMITPDERVHKLISVIVEAQLLKIIEEVKCVNIQTQREPIKTHFSFEDLQKAMEEFGIALRRPPFLEDKAKNKR